MRYPNFADSSMPTSVRTSFALALILCVGQHALAESDWGTGSSLDSNEYRVPRGAAGQTSDGGALHGWQPDSALRAANTSSIYSSFPVERRAYSPGSVARLTNVFIRESFYGSSPTNFGQLYGTGYGPNFFGNFGNAYGGGESRNYFGNYGVGYGLGESRKY
jgi:hypothetical protein